jgi:hypothetical protein
MDTRNVQKVNHCTNEPSSQTLRNAVLFMEPEGSFPASHQIATRPCPYPAESNPHPHILFL